jgi:hypothetical protein
MCDLLTSSVAGGVALYRGVGNAQGALNHIHPRSIICRGVARDARALDADSNSSFHVYSACRVATRTSVYSKIVAGCQHMFGESSFLQCLKFATFSPPFP